MLTEARLKRFKQVIGGEIGDKFGGKNTFKYFGKKREIGNGPEVA